MENFQSLGLPESLLNALALMQYTTPTPIQAQTIPSALQGLDLLGTAQTGTGKTAAYGIPLISHLLTSENGTALVLTPTRELATQVLGLLKQMLGKRSMIKTALIIGGDSMTKQLSQLSVHPRLIVGTPGRLNDHLARGTLKLDKTGFLVLDETDRMLDMGFGIQLEQIVKFLPHKRQTLMFSATLPANIQSLSAKYLKNSVRVSVGSTIAAADTIKQEIIRTSETEKYGVLLEQLEAKEGSVIIFVKTKIATEKLANKLRDHGHSADAIHGDLRQRNRERVINAFRNRKHRILVATDVAARGLDISHIECVINHDLPQCEEDFIHRIGRTGRAGLEGTAISLITPQDHLKWKNICKMMNPGVKLDSSFDEPRNAPKARNNNRRSEARNFGDRRPENGQFKRFNDSGFRRSEEGRSPYPRKTEEGRSSYPRNESRNPFPRRDEGASPYSRMQEGTSSFSRREEGRSSYPRNESRSPFPRRSEGTSAYPKRSEGTSAYPKRSEGGSSYPKNESRSPFPRRSEGASPYPKRSEGGSSYPRNESRSPFPKRAEGASPYPKRAEGGNSYLKRDGASSYPRRDEGAGAYPKRSEGDNFRRSSGAAHKPASGGKRPVKFAQRRTKPSAA